jgi:hypothetical protein
MLPANESFRCLRPAMTLMRHTCVTAETAPPLFLCFDMSVGTLVLPHSNISDYVVMGVPPSSCDCILSLTLRSFTVNGNDCSVQVLSLTFVMLPIDSQLASCNKSFLFLPVCCMLHLASCNKSSLLLPLCCISGIRTPLPRPDLLYRTLWRPLCTL